MSKESANYNNEGSIVVKRSPTISGRKNRTSLSSSCGPWVKRNTHTGNLRNSMSQNIHSLGRLLKELEQIMPRPDSKTK
jgi:hypothetical protein